MSRMTIIRVTLIITWFMALGLSSVLSTGIVLTSFKEGKGDGTNKHPKSSEVGLAFSGGQDRPRRFLSIISDIGFGKLMVATAEIEKRRYRHVGYPDKPKLISEETTACILDYLGLRAESGFSTPAYEASVIHLDGQMVPYGFDRPLGTQKAFGLSYLRPLDDVRIYDQALYTDDDGLYDGWRDVPEEPNIGLHAKFFLSLRNHSPDMMLGFIVPHNRDQREQSVRSGWNYSKPMAGVAGQVESREPNSGLIVKPFLFLCDHSSNLRRSLTAVIAAMGKKRYRYVDCSVQSRSGTGQEGSKLSESTASTANKLYNRTIVSIGNYNSCTLLRERLVRLSRFHQHLKAVVKGNLRNGMAVVCTQKTLKI